MSVTERLRTARGDVLARMEAVIFFESSESSRHTPCDVASKTKLELRFLNCGNHTECDWYYKITASRRADIHVAVNLPCSTARCRDSSTFFFRKLSVLPSI